MSHLFLILKNGFQTTFANVLKAIEDTMFMMITKKIEMDGKFLIVGIHIIPK